MPAWWPRKSRSKAKSGGCGGGGGKPGAAVVSEASSPRKSADLDLSASPSLTPRGREKARSLDSPGAARHGGGGGGGGGGGLGEVGYKLPVPVGDAGPEPDPAVRSPHEENGVAGDVSWEDSAASSVDSSDEAPDQHACRSTDPVTVIRGRNMLSDSHKILNEDNHFISHSMSREHHKFFEVPVTNMGELHLHTDDPSTSETSCSRGRMLPEDFLAPRTRSLSPGPKGHTFAVNNVNSREFGFSPRSPVKMMDGLKSPPHPLPLPPAPAACSPLPPSPTSYSPHPLSPTCLQSESQWKKGKLLGSGTFGQVYLGFNSENGQFCAIKEVQVISDDPHSKERLKQLNQEIDMLRQLSHPNIVQYYGSEMTDDALSIYLEYVSGGSIHKLLREYGAFKEPVIRNYTGQILSGLAYLHGRNTVHRDIKGANILVGPNGEVKLADFGMAKHISSCAQIRSLKGSPYWMAPEVIMNGRGYHLPVDIWSLGCTIIEMATASPPWHQYEGVAALFKIANSKEVPEIPDNFSEEGKSFLQLCLRRDPASRSTATQLMDHPFVQDHPAVRAAKSSALRNAFSAPADGRHTVSNREFLSRRSVAPLKDLGVSARNFTGFSTAVPSPHTASSPVSTLRTNMSLPVSPCSSPLRQFKQSNWSCLPSPPHPTFSHGPASHNLSSYMSSEMRRIPTISDTWQDISQLKVQSPYGSPKRF
ncbi:mitogen-activated protein kinase kinase kinase 3-like isoform X1 [Oryza brachyantha]|uniref:mitogen-activated protein kinase kinase kinase 3-like isoform X1 n=1 Tax=Oryza brachyantha TaxID=4533 RepID=UPI001ADD579A|nr:mitogen-activated protein kinase kinase kinase 3-like isoform X1 [Oryza brachyantha]